MHIRAATMNDMPALIELWTAAGLRFRPHEVPAELQAVLARDPELVLLADDGQGLAAAVLGTFDGRRGWVNRLATRPARPRLRHRRPGGAGAAACRQRMPEGQPAHRAG